jgi:hypothetical protein
MTLAVARVASRRTPRARGRSAHATLDRVVLGTLVALVYAVAWPPLYMRDGYVYHLLGRDLLANTNPHHLLWNAAQALVYRLDAVLGTRSVRPFQALGMVCSICDRTTCSGSWISAGRVTSTTISSRPRWRSSTVRAFAP